MIMEIKDTLYQGLTKLEHRRVSEEKLRQHLRRLFKGDIIHFEKAEDLIDGEDYRIDFACRNEATNREYDGSIWYAVTRTKLMYITEVAID
jgi:hypothetical protein